MHYSSTLIFAVAAFTATSYVSAIPPAAIVPYFALSAGISSGAIHKHHANEEIFSVVAADAHSLRAEVNGLMRERRARLERRQVGTAVGSAGIHKSHKLNDLMNEVNDEIDGTRHDVTTIMREEGLPVEPEEKYDPKKKVDKDEDETKEKKEKHHHKKHHHKKHDDEESADVSDSGSSRRLQRRQLALGLVLGPVSMHKARHDRRKLFWMRRRLERLHKDVKSIRDVRASRGGVRKPQHQYRKGAIAVSGSRGTRTIVKVHASP